MFVFALHSFSSRKLFRPRERERERERDALHATQTLLNGEENKYEPPNRELPRVFWGREPGREDEFDATYEFDAHRDSHNDESDIGGALKD